MRQLKFLSLLLVLPIFFFGCKQDSEVTAPTKIDFDSPQFAIIDYLDAQNGIEEATLETDMSFNNSLFGYSFLASHDFKAGMGPMMKGDPWMVRYDWNKHLGWILRKLDLTDDQKTKVGDLVKAYHESMKLLVQEFRDANKPIVESTNTERKAILESLKAGTITREEAKNQLKALNERTRKAIDENPKSIEIRKKMCELTQKLLDDIKKLLTDEQKTKWDLFTRGMKKPC
jgi:Spy/CpxP family protein refolding chaperone